MLSRRAFIKLGIAAGAAFCLPTEIGSNKHVVLAQIPGPTLIPTTITKYQTPLVIPPAMPRTSILNLRSGKSIDYYEIAVRQFQQQILPPGLPSTNVWSYGSLKAPGTVAAGGSFNYPALTIEALWQRPVRIKWVNDLVDANGNYLPHLLPVDPTLHWANPPGGAMHRDHRPTFTSTPGRYTGPVPIVTHVHGALDIGDESDGYTEAWFLPNAKNIPASYATTGTWYDTFKSDFFTERKIGHRSDAWQPGSATFEYPNNQRASTLWYHDHTLGMTRLNVYAGPAGFYLLRGGPDAVVKDKRTGLPAILPGPSPLLFQPIRERFFEIPIAIQDRAFNADGSLFYPDTRSFFDGIEGPYAPDSDVSPIWNPEFFGNVMVVNGATWPYLDVEQRRYRFRFLNGCDARFLMLQFPDTRIEVWQIGAEGGFLPAPVRVNDFPPDGVKDGTAKLLMCPAERADVIVDFSNLPVGTRITLRNLGPDEPFGGFPTAPADPNTTGQVMEFRVVRRVGLDLSTPPRFMQLPPIAALTGGATRRLALLENMSQTFDGPTEAVLGRLENGVAIKQMWMEPITENPAVGATEVWEFYNFTADAHPMHVHEVAFQLINRQPLKRDATGEVIQPVEVIGTPRGPEAWEVGLKDTVIAYPGEVTRIRAKFDTPGLFVWHCHIVEHEDNEMMRPYAVGPIPQPQAMAAATQPSTPIEDEIVEEVEDAYKVYLPYTNR